MIIKKKKKNLIHFTWLALIIIPSFYFKNLVYDSFLSLKFDKNKKKIYNKISVYNPIQKNNIEEMNNYILNNNFH
ncbi:conserved Plasmodium protein, unknown function [Plasmodium gallinaceum]|uniref:Uncharacterized protein n=1 Tax=Plasmodium gallinaceum TaxID=5849 RepID=A0A1J1GUW3_PLAGA|nr:conserved Plasmodium protein, unknown function [Plasmodium gallinaceum]CRG94833.1 conserved Plasmodium protein, unknown function [Plasmodium gallinaceum]